MSDKYPLALPLSVTFTRDDDEPTTVWAEVSIDGEPIRSGASAALVALDVTDPDHLDIQLSHALAFMPATLESAIVAAYQAWHQADDPHCTCNACVAVCLRRHASAEANTDGEGDATPAWWAPRIEFLSSGTDWDTVVMVLQGIKEDFCVRLTTTDGRVRDVCIRRWQSIFGPEECGILAQRNVDGELVGEPYVVRYEDIAAVGIY